MLFDIKRFAINDGPGIRVTLFMKGCPLRCVWCHNPEGLVSQREKLFNKKKCIGCQECSEVCPKKHDPRQNLTCCECGACAEVCPTRALEMAGREWSMDELMSVVEKERLVMNESGGGVTLCGGEPLMHYESALEILKELGCRNIHRCVDTTLFASLQVVQKVADECELFLVDLKHMDSDAHLRYTSVPNEQILSNIKYLSETDHPYWVRIPLIIGVNADEINLKKSAHYLSSLPNPPEIINLLPYHDIGKGKHERRNTIYNPNHFTMQTPSVAQQQVALDIFHNEGLNAKIGG